MKQTVKWALFVMGAGSIVWGVAAQKVMARLAATGSGRLPQWCAFIGVAIVAFSASAVLVSLRRHAIERKIAESPAVAWCARHPVAAILSARAVTGLSVVTVVLLGLM